MAHKIRPENCGLHAEDTDELTLVDLTTIAADFPTDTEDAKRLIAENPEPAGTHIEYESLCLQFQILQVNVAELTARLTALERKSGNGR